MEGLYEFHKKKRDFSNTFITKNPSMLVEKEEQEKILKKKQTNLCEKSNRKWRLFFT